MSYIDKVLLNNDLMNKILEYKKCEFCFKIQNRVKDLEGGICNDCIIEMDQSIWGLRNYGNFSIRYVFRS